MRPNQHSENNRKSSTARRLYLSYNGTPAGVILPMGRHWLSVLVVQWLSVGLVIERSLVRLTAGALSSQLGQLSLSSVQGR